MSTWRWFAITLLACSSSAGPRTQPQASSAPPATTASARAPVPDPACEALVHPAPPQTSDVEDTGESEYRDTGDGDREPAVPGGRRKPKHPDACMVTDRNIRGDGDAVLAEHAHPGPAISTAAPGKAAPQYLDLIARRFALSDAELARLGDRGVVVPARLEQPSYAYAYHEIFQSQLPVYISADSIFHAVFASHDSIVETLETDALAPSLAGALDRMHCALVAGGYAEPTARDLDVYLAVARSLAGGHPVRSIRGDATVDHEVDSLLARIEAASGIEQVGLFGRPRLIDFTQYAPRGHYTHSAVLEQYFQAAMWASRLEFNLVSRSSRSSSPGPEPDPSETPREAIDALALADLAHKTGADAELAIVDQAWGLLTGKREDVSIAALQQLQKSAGITQLTEASFPAFKQALGNQFQRTVRMHPTPEGTKVLPAIATLIGARIVPDAQALQALVNSAVPERKELHAADVAYSFGLDHAKRYLATDLAAFPTLGRQLEVARKTVATIPAGDDLYSAWYAAIRALAAPVPGVVPSVLRGDAGQDLRLNTIATAFGQLKHNYVLMEGQSYSDFGCEIPDGYVEPVPAAYDALIAYAERGAKLAALLDPDGTHRVAAYFGDVGRTLRVLRAIVDDELAGRALTATEKRWLGMVAELSVDDSADITGYPPVYSGWYFSLFPEAQTDGMRGADFIADYFTAPDKGIAYLGASAPRMAVFVLDTGGPRRAFIGPVARGFEVHAPVERRLTDDDARILNGDPPVPSLNPDVPAPAPLPHVSLEEPWAASYTTGARQQPPRLDIKFDHDTGNATLHGDPALGVVTVKLLDHHRNVIATKRQRLAAGDTVFAFHKRDRGKKNNLHAAVGGIYVEVGSYRDWVLGDSYNEINARWALPPDQN